MEIKVIRDTFTEDSTIGKMYINDKYHCYTLEDKAREVKVQNVTAIPKGRYEVIVNFSNRFQQLMPLLLNVPNFEGVRIHWGNYSKDTEGCILVGSSKSVNMVGNSRAQYTKLMAELKKATKTEKIFITIE